MKKFKLSEIQDELIVCPYCMQDINYNMIICCGEPTERAQRAYLINDEVYLISEVEIEDENEIS